MPEAKHGHDFLVAQQEQQASWDDMRAQSTHQTYLMVSLVLLVTFCAVAISIYLWITDRKNKETKSTEVLSAGELLLLLATSSILWLLYGKFKVASGWIPLIPFIQAVLSYLIMQKYNIDWWKKT